MVLRNCKIKDGKLLDVNIQVGHACLREAAVSLWNHKVAEDIKGAVEKMTDILLLLVLLLLFLFWFCGCCCCTFCHNVLTTAVAPL